MPKNIDNQAQLFEEIEQVLSQASQTHKPLIIAIDGRGGSGKSTLAKKLQEKFDFQLINTDDYFDFINLSPAEYFWNSESFVDELLQPITENRTGTYKKNLWTDNSYTGKKENINIYPNKPILIEGLIALNKDLLKYYTLSIWIEMDLQTALARAKNRDINEKGWSEESVDKNWETWINIQEQYITDNEPDKNADIVYSEFV